MVSRLAGGLLLLLILALPSLSPASEFFYYTYGSKSVMAIDSGKVTEIKRGMVMSQVKFTIPEGARMSSVITVESLDDLGIKEGDTVRVIIKAVSVLLVKE